MPTKPEVFIVESLNYKDEKADRFEGEVISRILRLNGKEPIYYYIRTQKELVSILDLFADSEYRYLHISCHASEEQMATTLDSISLDEFADIVNPYLKGKRLFVSACSMVNNSLAEKILPGSGCYS